MIMDHKTHKWKRVFLFFEVHFLRLFFFLLLLTDKQTDIFFPQLFYNFNFLKNKKKKKKRKVGSILPCSFSEKVHIFDPLCHQMYILWKFYVLLCTLVLFCFFGFYCFLIWIQFNNDKRRDFPSFFVGHLVLLIVCMKIEIQCLLSKEQMKIGVCFGAWNAIPSVFVCLV